MRSILQAAKQYVDNAKDKGITPDPMFAYLSGSERGFQACLDTINEVGLPKDKINKVADMQKLIDGYEQCIVAMWGELYSERFVAELPNSNYARYIQNISRFFDFVKTKHPEIIEEWKNNK